MILKIRIAVNEINGKVMLKFTYKTPEPRKVEEYFKMVMINMLYE